jgi:hypothetical protein
MAQFNSLVDGIGGGAEVEEDEVAGDRNGKTPVGEV